MKPCVSCQKNEAEYCSDCIDDTEPKQIQETTMKLAICISCETIINQKNVDEHAGHHIMIKKVQA